MKKVAVLISGRGSNFKALLDASLEQRIDANICAVISDKAEAAGLQIARQHDIPCYVIEARGQKPAQYDQDLINTLQKVDADWIALAGFMRILGPEFVQRYGGKVINIHPSLLPAYTGLDTHQRVIDANEQYHGATVHFVSEELDGGPIIAQRKLEILPGDTAQSLAIRVLQLEHALYPHALQLCISGKVHYQNGECYLDDQPPNASTLS